MLHYPLLRHWSPLPKSTQSPSVSWGFLARQMISATPKALLHHHFMTLEVVLRQHCCQIKAVQTSPSTCVCLFPVCPCPMLGHTWTRDAGNVWLGTKLGGQICISSGRIGHCQCRDQCSLGPWLCRAGTHEH